MEEQRRYRGAEGICRRYGDIWEYKDDTRKQRGYGEGLRDIWEYKDDTGEQRVIQLFGERLSEKVHATIPKGIVGSFEFTFLQRNLKEWHQRPWMKIKESNKSRFDSYCVRKIALIISHITFRDCRVHVFPDNPSRNSCMQKGTGIYGNTKTIQGSSGDMGNSTGLIYMEAVQFNSIQFILESFQKLRPSRKNNRTKIIYIR